MVAGVPLKDYLAVVTCAGISFLFGLGLTHRVYFAMEDRKKEKDKRISSPNLPE